MCEGEKTLEHDSRGVRMRRLFIILALVALGVGAWFAFLRPRTPVETEWQGYAEADFVKVGPTQPGLVTALHVARGDRVVKGAPLFDQDDSFEKAGVDQAARQLRQAEFQLANLRNPSKPSEIEQAEANLRDAEAARDKTQADLQRNQSLLKTGAATSQIVEQETYDLHSGAAKVAALQAQIQQLQGPMGRPSEIEAESEAVDAARAALAQAKWRLAQRSVVAPAAGVIADVMAQPGETLEAGAPVVSLLPPENIFVRFFIPEPGLIKVHVGDSVAFTCDNCPIDLTGTVSYIAPQAQYTPPFIYSESTRSKFVFLAEARPPIAIATTLNPGQPVTVAPAATKP
jgi:HlyD family secretion protein